MKARRKFYLYLIITIAFIYISLLTILYCSESADSNAMIRTFGDAFWYSLVTLTTVGYGDLVPVTPLGHTVGMIFLLLSAGIMVTMLGAAVSFITSEGLPLLMLSLQRHKNWYYFADCEAESDALAANIYREDPDALIIYGEKRGSQSESPGYPCIYLSASPAKLVAKKKNIGTNCKIFLMRENDIGINRRTNNLHELLVEVYARTTNGQEKLSENMNFFHSYECCARQYWRSKPLCSHEHTIVLIGFGKYGNSILERAILSNIISVKDESACVLAYHILFCRRMTRELPSLPMWILAIQQPLGETCAFRSKTKNLIRRGDSLIFHEEHAWEDNHRHIWSRTDRIIICE